MLRSFENLRLVHKLLIPLAVLAVTIGLILWVTQSGLNELRAAGESALDGPATRQALTLTIAAQLTTATVQEKSVILVTDPVEKQAVYTRYQANLASTLILIGQLAALGPTPADTNRAEALATLVTAFKQETDRSTALGLKNEKDAALQISDGPVRAARLKIVDAVKERVQHEQQETIQARADLGARGDAVLVRLYVCTGIGLPLALALFGAIVMLFVTRPITAIAGSMRQLADGDLKIEVVGTDRKDEIGSLAQSLMVFKANGLKTVALDAEIAATRATAEVERAQIEVERAREAAADQVAITALAEGLGALAEGDLTHQIAAIFGPKTQQLKDDFNTAGARLRDTMITIASAIQGMTAGTTEITQAADDLARRTEQQAASLEQTAAALDEITTTVRTTADGATEAQSLVSTAKADAEHSSEIVQNATAAMGQIEKSSQQVAQIIGVIDEIAFQTNLLALNAGVEAARAGEAGRGFAVVASEVRALAQRSADAAKEIKQHIATSSKQVEAGVRLVDETGQSLQRIVGHVMQVHNAVTGIAASAKQQATGLHEVNKAINQMDQVTQQNAAMVEQSTTASHSLARETNELAGLTRYFKTGAPAPRPTKATKPAPKPRPAASSSASPTRKTKPPPLKVVAPVAADAGTAGWEEF